MWFDARVRIDLAQPIGGRVELRSADVGRAVDDLALQVADVDRVVVHEADRADAGRREVHRRRRSQAAGADAEHARGLEPLLPFDAHLGQRQVPAVSQHLVARELTGPDHNPDHMIPLALRFAFA